MATRLSECRELADRILLTEQVGLKLSTVFVLTGLFIESRSFKYLSPLKILLLFLESFTFTLTSSSLLPDQLIWQGPPTECSRDAAIQRLTRVRSLCERPAR